MLYLLLILSIWWWLHRKACNRKLHVNLFIYDKNVDVKTSSLGVLMEYLHQLWSPWPNTGWRCVSVSIQTKEHKQNSRTRLMFLALPVRRIVFFTAKWFNLFSFDIEWSWWRFSKTWSITASELIILEDIIFPVISVLALTWYIIYIFSNLKLLN